jgi:hypothetical protein
MLSPARQVQARAIVTGDRVVAAPVTKQQDHEMQYLECPANYGIAVAYSHLFPAAPPD